MSRDVKGTIARLSFVDHAVPVGSVGVLVAIPLAELENLKLGGPVTLNLPEAKTNAS